MKLYRDNSELFYNLEIGKVFLNIRKFKSNKGNLTKKNAKSFAL